jgi:hypothetical protein
MSFTSRQEGIGRFRPRGNALSQGHVTNSSRGGFSARGRSGWRSHGRIDAQRVPDLVKLPLGDIIQTITDSDLRLNSLGGTDAATITDCKYLASYSWLNAANPTVLIPGVDVL